MAIIEIEFYYVSHLLDLHRWPGRLANWPRQARRLASWPRPDGGWHKSNQTGPAPMDGVAGDISASPVGPEPHESWKLSSCLSSSWI